MAMISYCTAKNECISGSIPTDLPNLTLPKIEANQKCNPCSNLLTKRAIKINLT